MSEQVWEKRKAAMVEKGALRRDRNRQLDNCQAFRIDMAFWGGNAVNLDALPTAKQQQFIDRHLGGFVVETHRVDFDEHFNHMDGSDESGSYAEILANMKSLRWLTVWAGSAREATNLLDAAALNEDIDLLEMLDLDTGARFHDIYEATTYLIV